MINKEKFEIIEKELDFKLNEDCIKKLNLWYEAFIQYAQDKNLKNNVQNKVNNLKKKLPEISETIEE